METPAEKEAKNLVDDVIKKVRRETLDSLIPTIEALKNEIEMIRGEKEAGRYIIPFSEQLKEFYDESKEEKLKEDYIFGGGVFSYTSEGNRTSLIKASRFRTEISPFIRNITNTLKASVTNKSVKIDIPNEKVDVVINDILKRNYLNRKLKGWVTNTFVDSEIFIRLYVRNDGNFLIRDTDPLEVTDIIYDEDDLENIKGFERQYSHPNSGMITRYYRNGSNDEEDYERDYENNIFMLYFKYGTRPGKRGESQLLPVLRWDRIYEDNLLDLATLYHERSKVVWIKEIRGNDVNSLGTTTKPYNSSVFRVETDTVKWRIEDSKLQDFNDDQYGRVHRLAIAAGVTFPETYVFSDSTKTAYASLRKAETPFSLLIEDTRAMWSENIKDMVKLMIRELVKIKKLPKTTTIKRIPQHKFVEALALIERHKDNYERLYEAFDNFDSEEEEVRIKTEDIPVAVFFPQHTLDNPLQQAQALEVLRRAGIISQRTAIKRAGEDPELEMALMKYDVTPISVSSTGTGGSRSASQTRTQTPDDNYDSKLGRD